MAVVAYLRLNKIDKIFNEHHTLESEDFVLRKIEMKDIPDIIELYSSKELMVYDRVPRIEDEKSAKRFIEEIYDKYDNRERIDWGIVHKETGKLIGIFALYNISLIDSRGEIGYILNPQFRHKGIMQVVTSWMIDFLFNYVGMHKLEANINIHNESSIRMCENVGFKMEGSRKSYLFNKWTGEFMDSYLYAIINDKWEIIMERM